jgi:excisionase family DNA binding protein
MEADSRDLLTVEQAANYLQLSQSSIRSYIRQGKLKAFRVAGKRKVLIPRDELLKLLEPARGDLLDDEEETPKSGGNNLPPRGFMGGK